MSWLADPPSSIMFIVAAVGAWFALWMLWSTVAAEFPMDWLEGSFLATISLVLVVGWVGVILASLGVFSLVGIALGLLLLIGGAVFWRRPFKKPAFGPITAVEIGLLVLLLACAVVYFRPHEYVLGGSDAGTYVNIGATIARTGKFMPDEPWTEFLSQYSAVTLREQPDYFLTRHLQFVGWYIDDHVAGRVIPQFFPFHPTLIAVGIQLAGIYGGLLVTPVWGVLGVAAVYLATRRLWDAKVALLAAGLLAITPTHIYFSRYPTTEPLTLLLVFAGLLAFQVLWDAGFSSRIWGVFFGGAFGAAFLTRIDLVVVFGCVVIFLGIAGSLGQRRPGWWAATLSFGIASLYATASALLINWPYTWNTYGAVMRFLKAQPLLIGLAVLGGLGLCVGVWLLRKHSVDWRERLRAFLSSRCARWVAVVAVLLLSAYAYFLRPIFEDALTYPNWMSGNPVMVLDALNWVRIGWYVTPLGLLLATVGLAAIFWKHLDLRWGLFLTVGILTIVQYVYKSFIPSYHIYMMRRYVPIVLPMLMIYATLAVVTLLRTAKTGVKIAGIVLTAGLIGGLVYQSRSICTYQDHTDMTSRLEALSAKLRPGAFLVISEPQESLFPDFLGVPLHFIFGYDIATIHPGDDESARLFARDLLERAAAQHRPVQLLAISPIPASLRSVWGFDPIEMFPLTSRYLQHTFETFPEEMQTAYYGIELYNVLPDPAAATVSSTVRMDIGGMDAVYIVEGFYNKELVPGSISARWTGADAKIEFPVSPSRRFQVNVCAMIYRPAEVQPTPVTVLLDGNSVGEFIPTETWQTFSFLSVADAVDNLSELSFVSTTFNPAELQVNTDTRDLGVLVDWIEIVPVGD